MTKTLAIILALALVGCATDEPKIELTKAEALKVPACELVATQNWKVSEQIVQREYSRQQDGSLEVLLMAEKNGKVGHIDKVKGAYGHCYFTGPDIVLVIDNTGILSMNFKDTL